MEDVHLPPPLTTPTFLCPPTGSATRQRRLSTSSMDSSMSHSSCSSRTSRKSKRANSRLSEFDTNNNQSEEVTLLTFLQSARNLFQRFSNSARRLASRVVRKSRPRPKLVCEGEILEQANMICRDYVVYKLTTKELVTRKLPLTPAQWPNSSRVIDACLTLEYSYPRIYSNISRKLCMTMTSTKVVRVALNSFLDVLFEGQTTWGKVVSMFSVCSLFAEECAMQGHANYIPEVVDTVVDFTNNRLMEWLVSQGGWDCFPCPSDEESVCDSISRKFIVVFVLTMIFTIIAVLFLNGWT